MQPTDIIDRMFEKDQFSKWLGIEILEASKGYCKLRITIREEMCNGFGIAHGGISYSLADSALAFASTSNGRHAVSIETSISHIKALKAGDTIIATATEKSLTRTVGIYEVRIETTLGELAALFKGTVYIKDTEWQ